MNTHQKVFFSCAVTLGVVAAAFASSPAPASNVASSNQSRAAVVAQNAAPEVVFERALIIGHRSETVVASNQSSDTSED